ncbi:hypothetical protein HNR42_000077 [Deinobacterium chartae]|uniref:Uncharacterized protein n=2 Tax=Deinobacterium chartae TaxID=521158 RepID=A0A841HXZ2_9DEIO|nr:hypothetical protein [Deinobacterium chartae]
MNEDMLIGRLGGADGYDVRCKLDGDAISGRAGGRLAGKDIHLEITETGVTGRVDTYPVQVDLKDGQLIGKVGDEDIVLRGVDRVTGRLGGAIVGWDFVAQQRGTELVGRLGGTVLGRDFQFSLGSAPGWIGTLVAVVAFYALERPATAK